MPALRTILYTLLLSLAAALAASAPVDAAAPPSREEAARAHYGRGAQLYRQGDYAGAWLEFTTAYQLVPRPQLLFNMARCEAKLGKPADAAAHFETYLEAFPRDEDAAKIRKDIELLKVEANLQKKRDAERTAAAVQEPPPPRETARRPWPVYGTIAGASTLLLGVVSVALLGTVGTQYGRLQEACAPNCRPDEVRPLEQQAAAGYAFLGLFSAGVVTTAALLIWELRRPPVERLRASGASPSALGISWRF